MQENRDSYRYDENLISHINTIFGDNPGDQVFENYILSLKTAGNVSPRTETLYIKDLFGTYDPQKNFIRSAEFTFLNFLSLKNVCSPGDVTREMLREYVVWLVENGIAKTSVNRRLSSVRSFYKFLLDEGKVKVSPIPVRTHQRNSPRSSLSMKLDQKIPVFLTQPDMEKLLNSPDITRPEGRRDRAMLELLYASGLRVSELWQLNLDSLNLESREIRVTGKGSKERIVLMGLPAVAAVKDYLLKARPELTGGKADRALFLNYQGRRLSMRSIQILLRQYAKSIGLEKDVHPHVLRHTFATHMLDGGADLRVVQELLGHADLSTTQIYTHVTKQQARKVYLKTHPMAQEEANSNGNQGQDTQTSSETG